MQNLLFGIIRVVSDFVNWAKGILLSAAFLVKTEMNQTVRILNTFSLQAFLCTLADLLCTDH